MWLSLNEAKLKTRSLLVNPLQVNRVLLRFTLQTQGFFSLQTAGLWRPVPSRPMGAMFPTTFAHFVCLYYIWVILMIFQTVSLLLYCGDLW